MINMSRIPNPEFDPNDEASPVIEYVLSMLETSWNEFYTFTLLESQARFLRTVNYDKWTAKVSLANYTLPDL